MDIIKYILSWIILIFLKFVEAIQDDIMILPQEGQESIKRKILQIPREYVTGIRSLADNSHVPLLSMEYQVQIHSTISEVQLIQEFQNPILGSFIQAEFYFQTKVTQTFVSFEVQSDGQILKGVVLDKQSKKSGKYQDEKMIPSPYAEIIEDIHDIIRLNLGFMYPGQYMKIVIKYIEELERQEPNVWKFTLPTQNSKNQGKYDNIFLDFSDCPDFNFESQNLVTYDWKINGQIFSSEQIKNIFSVSHQKDLNIQHVKTEKNDYLTYFSLDYGKNTKENKDFVLLITEEIDKDKNQSRTFIGYDPQDLINPYAALIRFSPLIVINPDESNSSCSKKTRTHPQNSQSQFLKNNNQQLSSIEESEFEENQNEELNNQSENKQSQQSDQTQSSEQQQQQQQNQQKKIERYILIVIEDILSSNQFSIDNYQLFIKNILLELINQISDYKYRQQINIFLISSQEMVFTEETDINLQNVDDISQIISKKIQIKKVDEAAKLPIEKILSKVQNKSKKQFLLLVGAGEFWNISQILYYLGLQKKLSVYGIGIGNRYSIQLFQRLEQMNCGRTFIVNRIEDVNQEINKIIIEINAPKFKKFTIIYDQKIVNTMSSIIDNINTISLTKSYQLNVFFNKNLQKLIKYSKKNQIDKICFSLVVVDEENVVYKTKAKIYFNQIIKTNVFHKLAANQQIQSYLVNALYKPEGFQNLSLIRQGTSAYERILYFSVKYQILSEVTTMYLLDSQFFACSKNLDQQIKNVQSFIIKLQLEQSVDEDELNIFSLLENLKIKNKNVNEFSYIIFKLEIDSKNNKKQQTKQKQPNQTTEQTCTLNLNPLNIINMTYQKIQQFKIIGIKSEIYSNQLYNKKKNEKGQSYSDIVRFLKDYTRSILDLNLKAIILYLEYTTFLLFTLIFT
ncbi:hypothetical protein TTHERM_00530530 (macronuclear) [Tetrahymena thermophila SB210]|uniref:VIT domain-containing protein n=1 Tax=Tetrahymena thermophila (strain SB210) TaxID=312017 RepID=I7MGE8_TETTS|nr:hypothetical protein TTHERM_00530530 [Tetrahymena thermophila SB210]EAR85095.2 hypothetical protein TTHERM_00530530 [Tetrahymena thermophila SB210]|eukprot:XP_001032758.2 hypothetical protein TTHERM_00530530 [Tetrahymena thermophila SB210]